MRNLDRWRFMRVNRNQLESVGIELLGSQGVGPIELAGNFTLQNVDLTDTQAEETHRPENLPEVFGGLGASFPLFLGITGTAKAEYTGSQFSINPNTDEDAGLESAVIFGGSISRVFEVGPAPGGTLSRVETRLSLDNVRDSPLYDAFGLPEPGRRLRFELRLF
jgi:hypothetical protein